MNAEDTKLLSPMPCKYIRGNRIREWERGRKVGGGGVGRGHGKGRKEMKKRQEVGVVRKRRGGEACYLTWRRSLKGSYTQLRRGYMFQWIQGFAQGCFPCDIIF